MFLKSHVAAKNGVLRRSDLLEIFDEPFRLAKYQRMENLSLINRQRSEAENMGLGVAAERQGHSMVTGNAKQGYNVGNRAAGSTYQHFKPEASLGHNLGASHLEETLNNRDVQW